ncbi:MAG: NADH-quinone oxidoreductase subunit L [Dehalococcoidia bacterium]|nr:NADH-quinone oxidoreductase subunit L [Dehalococcoidia bacterium]
MTMEQVWLLPAIPAGVFVILSLFNRVLPRRGDFVAVLGMGTVVVLAVLAIADFQGAFHDGHFAPAPGANTYEFTWVNIGDGVLRIMFSTYFDAITAVMVFVVSFVALMVFLFSIGYMHGEERYGWYFAVLSLFAGAMLLLVTTNSLIFLYLAWEGVGLTSYLLIGFYWERQSAAEAAKKAFITTRVGDVGFLIGIILLWRVAGTFDIQELIHLAEEGAFSETYLTVSMIFLFMGAVGKSAQFPLHVWLPDAMEGPTPVSALIHAATMVVAGVYLVARTLPIFDLVPIAQNFVLYTGLFTAVMAATQGLVANDIKRVLAYSTVSQLGFMFVALGLGSVTAAMFHLLTHAFFKSLLFLGSGSVIHATHQQEVEHLGGLWRKLPITTVTFSIGSLALAGIVPFAGFWSKDEILLEAFELNPFAYAVLAGTAALTALYTTRVVLLTFAGRPRDQHAYDHAHESGPIMLLPLVLLATLALGSGFVAFDGVGRALGFVGGIGQVVTSHGEPHSFAFHPNIAVPATVLALLAIGAGFEYWGGNAIRAERARQWAPELHALLVNRYYMDNLYQAFIDRVVLGLAGIVARFEKSVVNESGVDGGAQTLNWMGFRLKFLQTGRIPNYALGMALGVLVLSIFALGGGE